MPFGFSRICSRTPVLPPRLTPSRPWSMNGRCRWSPALTLQSSRNTSRRWWRWVFSHPHTLLFPVVADCMLQCRVEEGGGKWGESSVLILSTTVLTLYLQLSNFRWSKTWYRSPAFSVLFGVVTISTFLYLMLNVCVTGFNLSNTVLLAGEDWWASLSSMLVLSILFEHNKTQDSTTNWYEIVCTKGILVSLKRFLLKVQHQGEANISEDSGASASTMFSLCQTTLLNVRPSAVPT